MLITLENINKKEALRYLGYGNNTPNKKISSIVDECEKQLLSIMQPKFLYSIFDIAIKSDCIEVIDTNLILKGNDIINHLEGCSNLAIMCCTLSFGVDKLIRQYQVSDMTRAVICDSLSSASIEQVCDYVEQEIKQKYPDMYQTFRYSAGYGDLSIDIQKDILDLLQAQKKIGLCTTESSILTPKKSVTAFIGLSKNQIKYKSRGCQSCNAKDTCQFRKRGEHCEI